MRLRRSAREISDGPQRGQSPATVIAHIYVTTREKQP